ncbi:EndoU domain-containing protein [Mesobacillus maritimus]|uniref:EndoU domain-containing protein n=1 Tax=Mesobacillus maritimus TaxID=1643336 RepID=UPI00203B79FB|nr:EndoU domain-containing protein [Mesobacillus maritimus]MCM3667906.1 EndoU domain-containing protein [Mesobacillus maritimus]
MSQIKVKFDELEAFAKQIGRAEQQCDGALNALNWHFSSLLANFPGVVPGNIENLEADFKYQIKKYKSQLNNAQSLVKLTVEKSREAEKKISGETDKNGNIFLELIGWYDVQRLFGDKDPVTGEKLTAGDRTLAGVMLALSIFPPAKAVGIGGKVVVKGGQAAIRAALKSGLASLAKNPATFRSIKNVINPDKVRTALKSVYNQVVVGPLSATKIWFDNVVKKLGDMPVPANLQVQLAGVGAYRKTVREAFDEAKETIVQMAGRGKSDGGVGVVGKGTGKYNTGTIKHIYHGEINKRGKAVGYHHESMMGGKIIPGTESVADKKGVYRAKVEIDGVEKVAKSSFFPKEWNRVDVLKAIDEAYQNKKQIGSNKYIGETSSGIKIEMYINRDGSIATAYPLYNK